MTNNILAIETSADETSAAVLRKNKLLSNVISSQISMHRKTGGIVPEVAARAHLPKIIPVIKLALRKAKTNLKDITHIAVTAGPGLVTSLRIGVDTAKTLAYALGVPIIPINHMEGHLLSAFGGKSKTQIPKSKIFPAIGLTVSGGHTMLVLITAIGRYKILGETLDDAAGECFDKVGKILGLPYPGGPAISKLAERGKPNIPFPRPMIDSKSYNFSFAGLKTAVLYFLRDHPSAPRADIAASVEQAIIDVLVTKTLRAAKEYKVKTILLGGGVSANQKLRKTLKQELTAYNLLLPPSSLTTDNAGMIAIAAHYHAIHNHVSTFGRIKPDPNWDLKSWR